MQDAGPSQTLYNIVDETRMKSTNGRYTSGGIFNQRAIATFGVRSQVSSTRSALDPAVAPRR
jgi:hypothetical protein